MNYANQKRIDTKFDRCSQSELYHKGEQDFKRFLISPNWNPMIDVMIVLNATGTKDFSLWLYLQSWYGKGHYDFSPAFIERILSVSENTCRRMRPNLEKHGFLVFKSNNCYEFVPYPEGLHQKALTIIGEENEESVYLSDCTKN